MNTKYSFGKTVALPFDSAVARITDRVRDVGEREIGCTGAGERSQLGIELEAVRPRAGDQIHEHRDLAEARADVHERVTRADRHRDYAGVALAGRPVRQTAAARVREPQFE